MAAWVGMPTVGYTLLLYAFDRHDQEPAWALALLGGAGGRAIASGFAETWVDGWMPDLEGLRGGQERDALRAALMLIAPIEEFSKLLVVLMISG